MTGIPGHKDGRLGGGFFELIGEPSSQDIKVEMNGRPKILYGFFQKVAVDPGCFSGFIFRKPQGFVGVIEILVACWVVVEVEAASGSTVIWQAFNNKQSALPNNWALYRHI